MCLEHLSAISKQHCDQSSSIQLIMSRVLNMAPVKQTSAYTHKCVGAGRAVHKAAAAARLQLCLRLGCMATVHKQANTKVLANAFLFFPMAKTH